jgi:DNA-binding response OmpR family regulator
VHGKVLVVEDDREMAAAIADVLERFGFCPVRAHTAGQCMERWHAVDLVLLDLGLPDADGLEVCRTLAGRRPLIVVSARGDEADRVAALEMGADDYLQKPFGGRELVARCNSVLRRVRRPAPAGQLSVGDLEIDPDRFEVRRSGEELLLSTKEKELLFALARRAGANVRRSDLISEVWGLGPAEGRHTLDVHLSSLRRKLGDDPRCPRYIITLHGAGLRLKVGG